MERDGPNWSADRVQDDSTPTDTQTPASSSPPRWLDGEKIALVGIQIVRCRIGKLRHLTLVVLCGLVLVLATLAGVDAQARTLVVETLDEPLSLAGKWRFAAGDDSTWSDPAYDDSSWDELWVPGGWGRQGYRDHSGIGWYRLEVDLSRALASGREDLQIGVQLGEVTSSYEFYAGGIRIGGVGALPPEPRMEYDRHRLYRLPMAAIDANDRVVLAIRVWRSAISRSHEGGPTRGPFFIGRLEQLNNRALIDEIPYLALIAIFVAVGLYHLRLYAEHRGLVEHFWFGAFVLNIAAYCLLRTQWKYSLSDDFILLKNLEYVAIYAIPAIGIQFVASVYSRPIGRWLRAYQLSFLALAAVAGLTPDLRFNISTLWLAQIWVLPTIAYSGMVSFQAYRRGHPHAMLLPSTFFIATCLLDLAIDLDWVRGPRTIPVGMVVLILSMAASLANRLIRTRRELETLTDSLETRVAEQTLQLREHSEQLEQKNWELEEAYRILRDVSVTDPLTGLRNRRFLSEYLGHDVARVLREYIRAGLESVSPERSDLVFLMVDLDHFKVVNNQHGHDAGDQILKQTAELLREACRDSDFVVRWGGDEFLVVSRFVDRLGATTLSERIRKAISLHGFELDTGVAVAQTCSIGIASFPLVGKHPNRYTWQEVVNVADRMLYLAKEIGRNSWAGVCGTIGESGDDLASRISADLSGCLSRGEIRCETSRPYDEDESGEHELDDPEKGDPIPR